MRALGCVLAFSVTMCVDGMAQVSKPLASDDGLRGRVKDCIEETSYPARGQFPGSTMTTTRMYSPEGRLLEMRSGDTVMRYQYDAAGQLVSITPDGAAAQDLRHKEGDRTSQGFPEVDVERSSHVAIGAVSWEGSELQFQMPPGGTLTTIYDDKGRPAQAEIATKDGAVMGRITRQYDDKGRIVGEKLRPENIDAGVKAIAGNMDDPRLNEAQKKTLGQFMALAFAYGDSEYKYDTKGRLTEKHVQRGILGDQITKLHYNDHGDVSDEETTQREGKGMSTEYGMDDAGHLVAQGEKTKPTETTTKLRYAYEYDAKGNWTEKTTSRLENGEYVVSGVQRRKLTYYE